jgi:type II restriction/modification system DNA methylase subunit YeeA
LKPVSKSSVFTLDQGIYSAKNGIYMKPVSNLFGGLKSGSKPSSQPMGFYFTLEFTLEIKGSNKLRVA